LRPCPAVLRRPDNDEAADDEEQIDPGVADVQQRRDVAGDDQNNRQSAQDLDAVKCLSDGHASLAAAHAAGVSGRLPGPVGQIVTSHPCTRAVADRPGPPKSRASGRLLRFFAQAQPAVGSAEVGSAEVGSAEGGSGGDGPGALGGDQQHLPNGGLPDR
jgi:hypothetical protein